MKVDLALRNCSSVTLIGFCDACICCRLFTAFAAAMAFPLDCCHLELIFTEKRSFSRKKGLLFQSLFCVFDVFFQWNKQTQNYERLLSDQALTDQSSSLRRGFYLLQRREQNTEPSGALQRNQIPSKIHRYVRIRLK